MDKFLSTDLIRKVDTDLMLVRVLNSQNTIPFSNFNHGNTWEFEWLGFNYMHDYFKSKQAYGLLMFDKTFLFLPAGDGVLFSTLKGTSILRPNLVERLRIFNGSINRHKLLLTKEMLSNPTMVFSRPF